MLSNPIAVFDSGTGSISVIKELTREMECENLLYLADRQHFPYGRKTTQELKTIMSSTINFLEKYNPKLIIVASNTPSIQILDYIEKIANVPVIGITPPLSKAVKLTKKKHIGIMATDSTIKSKQLEDRIKREVPQNIFVSKFNSSSIVRLIEEGYHLNNVEMIMKSISNVLDEDIEAIDVITLSSTHLALIKNYLIYLFPLVKFIDPASDVAKEAKKFLKFRRILKKNGSGKVEILVSGEKRNFQKIIKLMGYHQEIKSISF